MKTMEQLQAALTAADAAYVEKTGKQPYCGVGAHLQLDQSKEWRATIWMADRCGRDDGKDIVGKGHTPEAAIRDLVHNIGNLPDEAEINLREFQRDLGNLIDKGRKLGVPVDYVNPLVETAKRLAENALTDQRERASA